MDMSVIQCSDQHLDCLILNLSLHYSMMFLQNKVRKFQSKMSFITIFEMKLHVCSKPGQNYAPNIVYVCFTSIYNHIAHLPGGYLVYKQQGPLYCVIFWVIIQTPLDVCNTAVMVANTTWCPTHAMCYSMFHVGNTIHEICRMYPTQHAMQYRLHKSFGRSRLISKKKLSQAEHFTEKFQWSCFTSPCTKGLAIIILLKGFDGHVVVVLVQKLLYENEKLLVWV